jgi:hypothetical protein
MSCAPSSNAGSHGCRRTCGWCWSARVEQFSTSEAAQILKVSLAALRARLVRARLLVHRYLANYLCAECF